MNIDAIEHQEASKTAERLLDCIGFTQSNMYRTVIAIVQGIAEHFNINLTEHIELKIRYNSLRSQYDRLN